MRWIISSSPASALNCHSATFSVDVKFGQVSAGFVFEFNFEVELVVVIVVEVSGFEVTIGTLGQSSLDRICQRDDSSIRDMLVIFIKVVVDLVSHDIAALINDVDTAFITLNNLHFPLGALVVGFQRIGAATVHALSSRHSRQSLLVG